MVLALAIVVAVTACGVILWRLDWTALSAFDGTEPWVLLLVAALLHLLTLPLKAVAWRTTLAAELADRPIPVRLVVGPVSVGALFNIVLVGRIGEAARILLMHSRLRAGGGDAPLPAVVGSAVTESIVSTVAWVAMVAGIGLVLPLPRIVWIVVAALGVAWIAILLAAARGRGPVATAASRRGVLGRALGSVGRVWSSVAHGHRSLRRPAVLGPLVIVSVLGWVAQGASVYAILHAFDIAGGWSAAALVLVSTTVAQTVPLLPGNVGVYQAAVALPLVTTFGTPAATAVAAGIVLQLVQSAPVAIAGAVSLARGGEDVGRVYRAARNLRGPSPRPA
ncbi:MAG: lysylphosphatidylglycerol synthase transmembrane domain-containing protein [Thermoleophilia bacterium]